jgi:hypothetical protein
VAHELSILRSAQRAAVRVTPYPHLVLRDALAERHYREIEPNARYQIPAEVALEKKLLPPC